jgi:hypothetical protein
MRSLELLRERIRPHHFEWRVDYDGQMLRLDEPMWRDIREEVLGSERIVALILEDPRKDASGFHVDYRGLRIPSPWPGREHDASVLLLRLPTEYLEEQGPAHVRALAIDLAEELPFNSGYVDLCLCELGTGGSKELLELVHARYPGIHVAGAGAKLSMDTWVDGVHWMNFLGQPVLGKLGGVSAVRQRLAPSGVSLQGLSGDRLLITLSEWPEVGDVEAGESLPRHRALARLLEPHLYHHQGFHELGKAEQLRWERRFLG